MKHWLDAISDGDLMPLEPEPQQELTHLIPATARMVQRNQWRTICGVLVEGHLYARNGIPTCPDCQRIDEEELMSLQRITAWRQS